ncbi:hypothetical protein ACHAWT_006084 [Skeletonema menzelii]
MTEPTGEVEEVILGPDLTSTRSYMDRKLYRHITLPNGLQCVLICDTVALKQRKLDGWYDDDDDDDDDDESDHDEAGDSSSGEESENNDEDGTRKAATALLVNVGSYHDPPYLQGLSHFLEHMLFLGTEAFPIENAYDSFLSQHGGDDNAYTDMEHTLYHYCIPQDTHSKHVWKALEMFSSFFKCPLLKGEMADRELKAVESEFELNKNNDDARLSQLMSFTCGMDGDAPIMGRDWKGKKTDGASSCNSNGSSSSEKPFHPFAKFPWGNMNSLKIEPEAKGIDVMKELRDHYDTHYYAKNMRLVVMAGYELDEIQRQVVQYFKDIPANPRNNDGSDGIITTTNLHPYKLPFHSSCLGLIYRAIPVRHRHTLTLTWQIPSICSHWRTKPAEYLAHLLGHEASGSILAVLKQKDWATGCSAGTGDDGEGNSSMHALFGFSFSLSEEGVRHWEEVIGIVFCYLGMLKYYFNEGYVDDYGEKKEGLPRWIYDELKSVAELSYKYADEGDVTDTVEVVAEAMAPWYNLPTERLLDGDTLLFDEVVDNDCVKDLIFNYFTPTNMRIDFMSSLFGRDADFKDGVGRLLSNSEEKKAEDNDEMTVEKDCKATVFDIKKAGAPTIEPRFETKFWVEAISSSTMKQWEEDSMPQLPNSELALKLPPINSYIPTKFELKPLPADDSSHPLLNCSVKVCIGNGKKKQWYPACVVKFKTEKNNHFLLLHFEDEHEQWYTLDSNIVDTDENAIEAGFESFFDNGKVKFKVTAVPREGEGFVFSYGDADHECDVDDGVAFPPIPPPSPASRLPQLVYNNNSLKVWHMQDRRFKRPQSDLRLNFVCDGMNDALKQACMDLFCKLCADALAETCYLASVCELGSSLHSNDTGFSIRVNGFDDKVMLLAKEVLDVVMSFRGRDGHTCLPSTIKDSRFDACLEVLRRNYSNSGMDASNFVTSLRLLCLKPSTKSSFSKLKALEGMTSDKFVDCLNQVLQKISVEAYYHGNVCREDADGAAQMISEALTVHHRGLPKKKMPSKLIIKAKDAIDQHLITSPTVDPTDSNTSIEVYFQIGKDDLTNRVLVDLLEHVLDEPFYNELRTKEQFGYEVSVGARWTFGVLGMSFKVTTSCKTADEASARVDRFLGEFRTQLESMSDESFMEHLVSLAKEKLEMFDSMADECGSHWSEICEGRYLFEGHRQEVQCLKTVTKESLLVAYDKWLHPVCGKGKPKKRRRVVFHVIGKGNIFRPDDPSEVGEHIDGLVRDFHNSVKGETWGKITF